MNLPSKLTQLAGHQQLLASKNSPHILFGVGVAGVIGSTVLACRATLKLETVMGNTARDLEIAHTLEHKDYTQEDKRKDIAIIYGRVAMDIGKLYGPAVVLGVASIGALTKSHTILHERNVALTAAYTAVDKAFNKYRERVVEKYGEDEDRELRYESEQVEVIDSQGKKAKLIRAADGAPSMYARFFDPYSQNWSKEPEYNLLFLRSQQSYVNDMFKARGHMFLNEVYRELGLSDTKAGSVVGWIMTEDSDNFIDFGIWDETNQKAIDFVNGREGSILLDFNVDGVIFDKIESYGERISWQK